MTGVQVVAQALGSTQFLINSYLGDLSDADLLVRPVPGANHTAWQIGHLINAEVFLVKEELPDAPYPDLPAGFGENHGPRAVTNDGPDGLLSKADYLDLFAKVREATIAHVLKLTDADLDRPTRGRMSKLAPTLGSHLVLVANHTLMHGGQVSVVRRKLGKPILF
jgi:hypothetical protein